MEKDFASVIKNSREIMNHGKMKSNQPKQTQNPINEGKDMPDLTGDYINKIKNSVNGLNPEDEFRLDENKLKTSKLPDSIKKAFMPDIQEQKQKQSLEQEYMSKLKSEPKQMVNEQQIHTSGLDEETIRGIVKDEMTRFLSKYFSKALTEQVKNQIKKQQLNEKRG